MMRICGIPETSCLMNCYRQREDGDGQAKAQILASPYLLGVTRGRREPGCAPGTSKR